MEDFGWRLSDLLFKLRLKQERIDALESGEEIVRLKEKHHKELAYQDRIIKHLQQTIAEKDRQIKENRKNWEQVHDDIMEEHKKALSKKDQIIAQKDKRISELEEALSLQKKKTNESKKEMYAAQEQLVDMQEQNTALKAQLNKDFTNSSKPSSQSPNRKPIHNSRTKSGRKPGGQPGHTHHGRKRQEHAKQVILPTPKRVLENPERYVQTGRKICKQLISAKLVVTATDYVAEEYKDLATGELFHADFPAGMVDDVEYDSSVKAMVFMLNNECNVSNGKTKQFLSDISRGKLNISTGAISNFTKEFSRKSAEDREQIKQSILASGIIHADYTFGRKQGKTSTVLIMRNDDSVLYTAVSAKGNAGVQESGLDNYHGILVSDHEAAFVNMDCRHQECMAHTNRYGVGSVENEPNLQWNRLFVDWNRRAIKHRNSYSSKTEAQWKERSEDLIHEFFNILKIAKKEYEYEPPGKYNKEGYNLYKRMEESPDDYILFLRDPAVPPTNNAAEQKGRVYKRKAHQVMCFRGVQGENFYCDAATILESARMQGKDICDEVTGVFDTIAVRQRKRSPNLTTLQKMQEFLSNPDYW